MQRDNPPFALSSRLKSFSFAFAGLGHMVRHEHNARIHLAATIAAVVLCVWLRISAEDWRWIILAIALVWICEAFNTAVEAICDLVSPDWNDQVRIAKDVAAAGALCSAIAAALIGASVIIR
jgi:diacylglycerol kinase (ATP)